MTAWIGQRSPCLTCPTIFRWFNCRGKNTRKNAGHSLHWSVLNLWNVYRQPMAFYPAPDLPYWRGIRTHWNTRPCLAALIPNYCLKSSEPLVNKPVKWISPILA